MNLRGCTGHDGSSVRAYHFDGCTLPQRQWAADACGRNLRTLRRTQAKAENESAF